LDVENLIRRSISGLEPQVYPSTERGVLLMDANTNLIGRNPAIERAARRLGSLDLNQYPSCLSDDLRAGIAKEHGLSPEESSWERLRRGARRRLQGLLQSGDLIGIPTPTFVMYAFFAKVHFGQRGRIPLKTPNWQLDVDLILRVRPKILFLASPNNPTGNAYPRPDLERLLNESPGWSVIDEAYADFCDQDSPPGAALREPDRLAHLFEEPRPGRPARRLRRLESEDPGEAAVREDAADAELVQRGVALEALADKSFLKSPCGSSRRSGCGSPGCCRTRLPPEKTDANFMLVDVGLPSGRCGPSAREGHRDARDGGLQGSQNHLRVTVGRPEHSDRLVAELKNWKASCSR